jgi:hypothetical protein
MTEHPTKQSWRRGNPEPPQGINVLWDPDPMAQDAEAYLCRLADGTWEWFRSPTTTELTGPRVNCTWDEAIAEADGALVLPLDADGDGND